MINKGVSRRGRRRRNERKPKTNGVALDFVRRLFSASLLFTCSYTLVAKTKLLQHKTPPFHAASNPLATLNNRARFPFPFTLDLLQRGLGGRDRVPRPIGLDIQGLHHPVVDHHGEAAMMLIFLWWYGIRRGFLQPPSNQ